MNSYITTTIPYVNARPHIGFALELVQADALARYRRLCGDEVRLQTGTDDNAWKNVESARAQGISPQEFVDRNAEAFRRINQALRISADDFVRTTEARHHGTVHAVWRRLHPGDVYLKQYTGLYCTGCEDFYLERDLVDGLCPDHKTPPIAVQEENYFFRLSAYQQQIEALITSGRLVITPDKRRQEVLNFVRQGLQDISVSRRRARAKGWGIAVPDDPSQTIYVWIDALVNYVTGPGIDYWSPDVRKIHCLGKNVWKFHAVYWPALLLSAGLPAPDELIIHGFLTVNGEKISKSLGNAIDPLEPIAAYGADAVRYYLLREVSPWDDGDFSEERLHNAYHQDLANNLGNLVSRLTNLCQRGGFQRFVPAAIPEAPAGYHEALRDYAFDRALEALWNVLTGLNQQIEHAEPWKAIKAGKGSTVHPFFQKWLGELYGVAYWLAPFLPETSGKVREILCADPISAPEPLFPRLG
ncbi:MAG: methionine--tRNA ligase [Armatimonadota bacterium]